MPDTKTSNLHKSHTDVPTGTSTWSDAWSNRARFALWHSTSGTALQEKQHLSLKPLNRKFIGSCFYLVVCCSSLLCQQDFLIHQLLDARRCRDRSCRVEGWAAGLSPPAGRVPAAVFVTSKHLNPSLLQNISFKMQSSYFWEVQWQLQSRVLGSP